MQKKHLGFILTLCMILTALVLTFTVGAAIPEGVTILNSTNTTVDEPTSTAVRYVNENASSSGVTGKRAHPYRSIADAYNELYDLGGGTIVICGPVSLTPHDLPDGKAVYSSLATDHSYYWFPTKPCSGTVKITSVDPFDNWDYRGTVPTDSGLDAAVYGNATLSFSQLILRSNHIFENVTLTPVHKESTISCAGNDLYIATGVKCNTYSDYYPMIVSGLFLANDNSSVYVSGYKLLWGGSTGTLLQQGGNYKPMTKGNANDNLQKIRIRSGTWRSIRGGNHRAGTSSPYLYLDHTVRFYMSTKISSGADKYQSAALAMAYSSSNGSVTMQIDGGTYEKGALYLFGRSGASDSKTIDGVHTLLIRGGTFADAFAIATVQRKEGSYSTGYPLGTDTPAINHTIVGSGAIIIAKNGTTSPTFNNKDTVHYLPTGGGERYDTNENTGEPLLKNGGALSFLVLSDLNISSVSANSSYSTQMMHKTDSFRVVDGLVTQDDVQCIAFRCECDHGSTSTATNEHLQTKGFTCDIARVPVSQFGPTIYVNTSGRESISGTHFATQYTLGSNGYTLTAKNNAIGSSSNPFYDFEDAMHCAELLAAAKGTDITVQIVNSATVPTNYTSYSYSSSGKTITVKGSTADSVLTFAGGAAKSDGGVMNDRRFYMNGNVTFQNLTFKTAIECPASAGIGTKIFAQGNTLIMGTGLTMGNSNELTISDGYPTVNSVKMFVFGGYETPTAVKSMSTKVTVRSGEYWVVAGWNSNYDNANDDTTLHGTNYEAAGTSLVTIGEASSSDSLYINFLVGYSTGEQILSTSGTSRATTIIDGDVDVVNYYPYSVNGLTTNTAYLYQSHLVLKKNFDLNLIDTDTTIGPIKVSIPTTYANTQTTVFIDERSDNWLNASFRFDGTLKDASGTVTAASNTKTSGTKEYTRSTYVDYCDRYLNSSSNVVYAVTSGHVGSAENTSGCYVCDECGYVHHAKELLWHASGTAYKYGCSACGYYDTLVKSGTTLSSCTTNSTYSTPFVYVDGLGFDTYTALTDIRSSGLADYRTAGTIPAVLTWANNRSNKLGDDTANGLTTSTAALTINEAVRRMRNTGGEVRFCDVYEITAPVNLEYPYANTIYFTSMSSGGTSYGTNAMLLIGPDGNGDSLNLNGPSALMQLKIRSLGTYNNSDTVFTIAANWNNFTVGSNVDAMGCAYVIAGANHNDSDYTTVTSNTTDKTGDNAITINLNGVTHVADPVKEMTLPFYKRIYLGERMGTDNTAFTLSNKTVNATLTDVIADTIYMASTADGDVMTTSDNDATVNLNGSTTWRELRTGYNNTTSGKSYLDSLTLNFNDTSNSYSTANGNTVSVTMDEANADSAIHLYNVKELTVTVNDRITENGTAGKLLWPRINASTSSAYTTETAESTATVTYSPHAVAMYPRFSDGYTTVTRNYTDHTFALRLAYDGTTEERATAGLDNITDCDYYCTVCGSMQGETISPIVIKVKREGIVGDTATVKVYLVKKSNIEQSLEPFQSASFKIGVPDGFTLDKVTLDQTQITSYAHDTTYAVSYDSSTRTMTLASQNDEDGYIQKTGDIGAAIHLATLTYTITDEWAVSLSETTDGSFRDSDDYNGYWAYDLTVQKKNTDVDIIGEVINSAAVRDYQQGMGLMAVLSSDYVLKYYVPTSYVNSGEDFWMTYEKTDASGAVTSIYHPTYTELYKSQFRFSVNENGFGIAAKNLNDKIVGTYFRIPKLESSDADYGLVYLTAKERNFVTGYQKTTSGTSLNTLMQAILNYGAAAQTYFGYNTADDGTEHTGLVNKHLPEAERVTYSEEENAGLIPTTTAVYADSDGYAYTIVGQEAKLTQRITVSVKFSGETANASNLVFKGSYTTVNGQNGKVESAVAVEDSYLSADIDQIAAKDLRQSITGALYDTTTGEQVSPTITTSFECYVAQVFAMTSTQLAAITDKPDELKAVCLAALAYSDAAKIYFMASN